MGQYEYQGSSSDSFGSRDSDDRKARKRSHHEREERESSMRVSSGNRDSNGRSGRRVSSDRLTPKHHREERPPVYEQHSEDEESYTVEQESQVKSEFGKSTASVSQSKCPPASMLKLCEVVLDLAEKKRLPDLDKFHTSAINSLTRDNEECFDFETRTALPALFGFYKEASAARNIPFLDAIARVKSYIENEPSVILQHSKFPQKSVSAINVYYRKLQAKGSKMKLKDAKIKFENDPTDPEVTAAINEFNEENENYGERIRGFMDEEKGSILPHQKTYLNKVIRMHEDKLEKAKKTAGGKRNRSTKTRADVFAFYVNSMEGKYTDLSGADRTKKLKQLYDEMGAEARDLLEQMAKK